MTGQLIDPILRVKQSRTVYCLNLRCVSSQKSEGLKSETVPWNIHRGSLMFSQRIVMCKLKWKSHETSSSCFQRDLCTEGELLVRPRLFFVYTYLLFFVCLFNDSFCYFFVLSSFSGERHSTGPRSHRWRSKRLSLTNTARRVGAECEERVGHPWKWTAPYCFCLDAPRFVWSDEGEPIVHSGEAWGNGCRSWRVREIAVRMQEQ
jgi:hypothetical protein